MILSWLMGNATALMALALAAVGCSKIGKDCKHDSDCGGPPLICIAKAATPPIPTGTPAATPALPAPVWYCGRACAQDGDCASGETCAPTDDGRKQCVRQVQF